VSIASICEHHKQSGAPRPIMPVGGPPRPGGGPPPPPARHSNYAPIPGDEATIMGKVVTVLRSL